MVIKITITTTITTTTTTTTVGSSNNKQRLDKQEVNYNAHNILK
jgi:hypothetical protein